MTHELGMNSMGNKNLGQEVLDAMRQRVELKLESMLEEFGGP
ncbi:MAG: hypothetical protein ACFFCK_10675 [Promethearchaeota archaeon]